MPTTPLLPLADGLEIISMSKTLEGLLIRVISERPSSPCPVCMTPSQSVHSYYRRKPLELPCAGQVLRLLLCVRKFFCRVESCPRKVFTERLPEVIEPYSRLTSRLRSVIQAIGFAFNGKGGARLAEQLGIQVSRQTLLKSLHLVPTSPAEHVRVVGIDDFAWKRGKRYGTLIIDLETHKLIDLLPDREAASVQQWLEAHPEIEIVSRDRASAYADGAAQGAPQARQVADRWHLTKNLGDAVEAYLLRKRLQVPPLSTEDPEPFAEPADVSETEQRPTEREQQMQANRTRKQEQHDQVHLLHQQGMSIHGICRHLGLARNTVRRHLRMGNELQVAPRPKQSSILDPYYDYMLKRWREGCTNGEQILREIRALGYRGSATTARTVTTRLRKNLAGMAHPPKYSKEGKGTYTPRELRWLLAKQVKDLKPEEQADLARLLEYSQEAEKLHRLLQDFLSMLRGRLAERLDGWMKEAKESGIKELRSFVAGIERDYDAVKAGLSLPWSQGAVEGSVNKLKMHKRLMYGRAGFRLLRQKLLHQT